MYTFQLVKVTVDSSGKETGEAEVKDETYGTNIASDAKGGSITFTEVTLTDANGETVLDENGAPVVIHVFQLTSDDYAHFTKLSDASIGCMNTIWIRR